MKGSKTGLIEKAVTAISSAVAVWIIASWADVICHNVSSYSYASWNLFELLF